MMPALTVLALILLVHQAQPNPGATECQWSTDTHLPVTEKQPLYIDPTKDAHNFNSFFMPTSVGMDKNLVTLPPGRKILFACPGSTLDGLAPISVAQMTCKGGRTFTYEDAQKIQDFQIENIRCEKSPSSSLKERTDSDFKKVKCGENNEYTVVDIGYEVHGRGFYPIMEICFDNYFHNSHNPVYSKHTRTSGSPKIENKPRPPWINPGDYYPKGLDLDKIFTLKSQRATLNALSVPNKRGDTYIPDRNDNIYFLTRGHLTAKADFVYSTHQLATFNYLNSAPQWMTFNRGNWEEIEFRSRHKMEQENKEFQVYTGTFRGLQLPSTNTNKFTVLLGEKNKYIKVPLYYWRVVHDPIAKKGIAYVGINDPFSDAPLDHPCGDSTMCTSKKYEWMRSDDDSKERGFVYCCEVDKLRKTIKDIPALDVTGGTMFEEQ